MMNKISGDVLALLFPSLSSKYYWRQFASQYLTKLIRCAVAVAVGGKRGQSRWPVATRPRPRPVHWIFCPRRRLESVYFDAAVGHDGSVHIANKN